MRLDRDDLIDGLRELIREAHAEGLKGVTIRIIGGAALTGGRASLAKTLLGALFISVLNNGLTLLNINSYLQYIIKGAIILLAVVLDRSSVRDAT